MPRSINREWLAAEIAKRIGAEQALANEARSRAEDPPDPLLQVLYHEIADADQRHRETLETIATRYGYNPTRSAAAGLAEALSRLKERVAGLGSTPLDRLAHDLVGKADAIHWCTAWASAFEALGEIESARELNLVLDEEKAHHSALQLALNRLVESAAQTTESRTG
jgi:hypothetical protein